jgi:RimJ/RimL family protein N-acetyltransferase
MNIYGKKVVLRAIEMEDCALIIDMFNDPEIENLVGGWTFPLSLFAQKKWLEAHYNDRDSVRFVIDTEEDGAIGIMTLTAIDWKNRNAELGAKIASKQTRFKGYGTDAMMAIMRYAFDELGFHRLEASRLATNQVSERLLAKCGFVEEGIKRDYIYKGGKYIDLVVASILADEYNQLISTNQYWND